MSSLQFFLRRATGKELELTSVLSLGPWCWPRGAPSLTRAQSLVESGPPEPRPGEVLLVSVTDPGQSNRCANLWVLRRSEPLAAERDPTGFGSEHALGHDAKQAWDDAALALPRSVPVLWRSVHRSHAQLPRLAAVYLDGIPLVDPDQIPLHSGSVARPERVVDGRSFGVSFLLSLASSVLGVPVPSEVAATGQIDPEGRVGEVAGVGEKVRALIECAPAVTTILVPKGQEQEDDARAAVAQFGNPDEIEVVPVESGTEVIERVFDDQFAELVARAQGDDRGEILGSLRHLALEGRMAVLDWTPVAQTADRALNDWKPLSENEEWWLKFVRAIALRHEENAGQLPDLDEDRLAALPITHRLQVIAHYVQQCTDTGAPSKSSILRFAQPYLDKGLEATEAHLQLQGAVARLYAVTGAPERALELQEDATRGFFELGRYGEISYPLSEWYRLAGLLSSLEAFQRAEEFRFKASSLGQLKVDVSPYVQLARGQALVLLEKTQEAEEVLRGLIGARSEPGRESEINEDVRWSATRWLVRLLESRDEVKVDTEPLLEVVSRAVMASEAGTEAEQERSRNASRVLALVSLDRCMRDGNEEGAYKALSELAERDPGPVAHLKNVLSDTDTALDRSAYVADHYPY